MNHSVPAYGLWALVLVNSAVFILFAFSFARPRTPRDWRSLSAFSAFILALFTEMYGFPLTIYLLSGCLARHYPGVDFLSHDSGHLWETLFGWSGNPHSNPLHFLSNVLIFGGFLLLSAAWSVLYAAQRSHALASTGVYAHACRAGGVLKALGSEGLGLSQEVLHAGSTPWRSPVGSGSSCPRSGTPCAGCGRT